MNFDVKFKEQDCCFSTDFGEVQSTDVGDYDKGYTVGYEVGHEKGYTEGEAVGYDRGLEDGKQSGGGGEYDQGDIDDIFSGAVTELRIETQALTEHGCRGRIRLTKVVMPNMMTIQSYAFYNCTVLETVIIGTNAVATLKNVNCFNNTPIAKGTGYIYVPAGLVDAYKTANNWSNYASQIRAIEDYPDITQ